MKSLQRDNLKLKLELERTKELLNLYRHDTLTGLKMRRDFEFRFTEMFESGVEFYLAMADVNGLHALNREENFDAGDRLIKSVAHKFLENSNGIVYRIGGDEFVSLSLNAPECVNSRDDNSYICAWVSSKNYKTEKTMFDACDKKIIKGKEVYYAAKNNDRRV